MKKLFSSVISLFTACTLIPGGTAYYVMAEDVTAEVDCDLSDEMMYLDDMESLSLSMATSPIILSNYSDSAYNYKDFLDSNNLAVYEALSVLVTPTEDSVTVKLPETLSISVSSLPSSSGFTEEDQETYQNAVFTSCKPGIDSLIFDMPEICWMNMSMFGISVGDDTTIRQSSRTGNYTITVKSLTFSPTYYEAFGSLDTAREYVGMLNEAVDEFPVSGNTRYDKLKSIHDYISQFTYYDASADFSNSALGALVQPGVVCEGYSKAFKLICDSLDIPCILIFGNYNQTSNVAHMWNYVQMEDGLWYAVDVTWDDLDNDKVVKYDYFLKGSANFNTNHTPESSYNITYFNYPELSETDYDPSAVITTGTTTTTTTTTITSSTTTTTTSASSKTTTSTSTTTSITSTTTTTSKTTTSTSTASSSTTTETTTSQPEFPTGDVNHDGSLNIADLVYCQNAVLARIVPEYSCDANGDGKVNSFDTAFIRKLLIK